MPLHENYNEGASQSKRTDYLFDLDHYLFDLFTTHTYVFIIYL